MLPRSNGERSRLQHEFPGNLMQFLATTLTELLDAASVWSWEIGLIAVLAGLVAIGSRMMAGRVRRQPRQQKAPPAPAPAPAPVIAVPINPDQTRRLKRATPDLDTEMDHVSELASLHARAASQIDATEYAFDRMLAECRGVMPPGMLPQAAGASSAPASKPAAVNQPLAA